jgi:hypothetical protein
VERNRGTNRQIADLKQRREENVGELERYRGTNRGIRREKVGDAGRRRGRLQHQRREKAGEGEREKAGEGEQQPERRKSES